MFIGGPSNDPGGEEGQERVPLTTLAEAIARAVGIMPADIQQRYLVGPTWEEILGFPNVPMNHFVSTSLGAKPAKLYLAVYLVNIVVQSLFMELSFGQKVDPVTRDLEELDDVERKDIEATVKKILAFVRDELGVQVDIVEGMPLVAI